MRRAAKLIGSCAVAGVVVSVLAITNAHAQVAPNEGLLGFCVGETPDTGDQVIAEGRTYIKPFTLTVAPGETAACRAFAVRPGSYWVTGGKYPQVPCAPVEHRGALGNNVCLGKVHHFHVTHRPIADGTPGDEGVYVTPVGADSTIEQPAVFVQVRRGEFSEVRFHVVDAGTYPECIPNPDRSCS